MSTPSLPPRRLPEPVETTTKTSRRFVPEPTETTTQSSRRKNGGGQPANVKWQSEHVETATKPSRRFVPEPTETTTKSSRSKAARGQAGDASPKTTPQPIETSTKSNRKGSPPEGRERSPEKAPRKFVPEPIEISTKTSRRRFTPQLIETTKRTRKSGDVAPALLPTDKTEVSPGDDLKLPRHARLQQEGLAGVPEDATSTAVGTGLHPPRRSSSLHPHVNTRRHSFAVPALEAIESNSEDDDSNCPSLSTSASASSSDNISELYKHATRVRESCDDRFSGYLLALAAKAAEKQLRESALAVYPNEEFHETVDHYIDTTSDLSSEGALTSRSSSRDEDGDVNMDRRESAAGIGWELLEMRKHQERMAEKKAKREASLTLSQSHSNTAQVARGANDASAAPKDKLGGWKKGAALKSMKEAASPPLLGADIKFPRCLSPKSTRLDVDQYPRSHQGSPTSSQEAVETGGLWAVGGESPKSKKAGGLWMGCCKAADEPAPQSPRGIMTPAIEKEDPFNSVSVAGLFKPPGKAARPDNIPGIDNVMSKEEEMEREFNDSFVTQVYNYLSLGYPSVARKFDEELSKISRVPVEELSKDDQRANAKGYVDIGLEDGSPAHNECARWRALRAYIWEWGRQRPGMAKESGNGRWGVLARKGSWAV
ncbi:MAG: hypothetical protein M1819_004644 [Sarea resinae]|nr:MAG: hypothetical protein M1819_004644 [Sarea resinae]